MCDRGIKPPGGGGGGGLNSFYWVQIYALDSVIVEIQERSFIFMSVEFQRGLG